jgi:hypothetical protein
MLFVLLTFHPSLTSNVLAFHSTSASTQFMSIHSHSLYLIYPKLEVGQYGHKKSGSPPIFIKFYWNTTKPIHYICIVYDLICTVMTKLNNFLKNWSVKSVYNLSLQQMVFQPCIESKLPPFHNLSLVHPSDYHFPSF